MRGKWAFVAASVAFGVYVGDPVDLVVLVLNLWVMFAATDLSVRILRLVRKGA